MKVCRTWTWNVVAIAVLIGAVALPSRSTAQEQIEVEDFRQTLLDFLWAADLQNGGPVDLTPLYDEISQLSSEGLASIVSHLPDTGSFVRDMEKYLASPRYDSRAMESAEQSPESLNILERSHPAQTEFPPAYPTGGGYDVFTATLPGLGLLNDGPTNRTDAPAVGDTYIVFHTATGLAIAAQAACDGFFPACVAAGVANGVAFATQIVLDQTAYQDGLIDGAEIEATYENSRRIITQGNGLETDLSNHDTAISGQLTTHDTAITNHVSVHDSNIAALLATHDALINGRVATHDTEIKALLTNLQGTVDENQRLMKILMSRQLEIMRLLITAQGLRAINLDVLTCTGDNCPVYPAIPSCQNGSLDWPCRP